MRFQRPILWRTFTALVGVAALGAISARGAEGSAATTSSAPAGEQKDSISAAKREFDAMKALRDPSQQQKGALPRFATPELHTDSGSGLPSITRKDARPDATKKTGNWLVDAMEKSAREDQLRARGDQAGRGDSRRDELTEQELLVRGESETQTKLEPTDTNQNAVRETKEKTEVVNPLTQYLSDWMTPRDYAVLKPGLDEAASGKNAAELRANESLQLDLPPSLAGAGSIFSAPAASNMPPPAPRENPYLQGIVDAPTASAMPFVLPPAPATVTAPPPRMPAPVLSSGPAPVIAPPPKIPDFAKPAHDEKYFKQLKRF